MSILKWAVIMLLVSLVAALFGFTDLAAGLLAAALALLGGVAYTEWGVVAVSVGATLCVVVPALAILVGRRPPAAVPEPAG